MKFKPVVSAACIGAVLFAWPAHSQNKPDAQPPKQEASETSAEKLIRVDFPGGTAAEYIDAVRKAAGQVNVVVLVEAEKIPMPPVKLQLVDPWGALQVLDQIPNEHPGRVVEIGVRREQSDDDAGLPVYVVVGSVTEVQNVGHQNSMVISISDVIGDDMKAQDVLTAVETSLAMLKNQFEPAQLKFHAETGLLIARGHPQQMNAIQQVVDQLREKSDRARQRDTSVLEMRKMREMLDEAEQGAREVGRLQEANTILRAELDESRRVISSLEQAIRDLRAQLDAATRGQAKPG